MVGRLYHEEHGVHFADNGFPEGIQKFMRANLADELRFEAQKGSDHVEEDNDRKLKEGEGVLGLEHVLVLVVKSEVWK